MGDFLMGGFPGEVGLYPPSGTTVSPGGSIAPGANPQAGAEPHWELGDDVSVVVVVGLQPAVVAAADPRQQ